jgi:hypothetical protein
MRIGLLVANSPINMIDPLGLWGVFAFSATTVSTPNPGGVILAAEGIVITGWDSDRGFYSEVIKAVGVEVGTHNDNVSAFRGAYTETGPKCPTNSGGITLLEGNLGVEGGVGGASVGSGGYRTDSGDTGPYVHAGANALGQGRSVGVGGSLPQSVVNAWSDVVDVVGAILSD